MSETSLFAELVKDRNRKEVEAKLAAAKELKSTASDIPMPNINKDEEGYSGVSTNEAPELKSDENTLASQPGSEVGNVPKLSSPKFFEDVAKEIEGKETVEPEKVSSISERKSIEMDIEDTGGGIIHEEDQIDHVQSESISSENLIVVNRTNTLSPMKTESNEGKFDPSKKNALSNLDSFRKGTLGETLGETLRKTAELTKIPKFGDKNVKKENVKSKHGSLINKMPLPPGMKSTDLESIDSPPSRSPSPLPPMEKKKPKTVKSIKDLPLPPGKRS